jgi:cell division protein FtsW
MAAKKADFILLSVAGAILIFGIVMLASVSAKISQEKLGSTYYFLNHQLLYGVLPGLILGFLAFRLNLKKIKKWAPYVFLANIALMLLVLIPQISFSAGGASRWLAIGPFTAQPSEFLKLSIILYLASWLPSKKTGKTFFPFLAILLLVGILFYLQPDIGTYLVIAATCGIMYFLANTPLAHTFFLISLGISGFVIFMKESYRQNRINVFLNPQTDPMGIGYQIKQALIAVGSGGIFGLGLGMSRQKYGFLPEAMSDSIFAVLCEEVGFIGAAILIAFFITFFWRGFKLGRISQDPFSKLAAFGITFWILLQTLINISSMTGILPLTGIPLPFFSNGGSAMIANLTALGVLLNISKQSN